MGRPGPDLEHDYIGARGLWITIAAYFRSDRSPRRQGRSDARKARLSRGRISLRPAALRRAGMASSRDLSARRVWLSEGPQIHNRELPWQPRSHIHSPSRGDPATRPTRYPASFRAATARRDRETFRPI